MVRGGSALGNSAAMCFQEDVSIFVDACFTKVAFLEAADLIDDVL